ncbi:hypothetical protein BOTBODRAFT_126929 [Botryobasidium botryosum FD-172 SS1]|uniref:Major facilitator superfamily (MFS) profile domain-containing protein n=1 Tax=Botryobasidium botryosum (strain FD-172 SS1) TaxID=930990 RepID=A0A067MWI0_BOTB1|nr:hypothetical protein BOTBODRAFT_126929 [Botryobasidium botryosum FD-172 SS1]
MTLQDPAIDERQPLLAPKAPPRPSPPGPLELTRRQRFSILAGTWSGQFLGALNTTLVATLLSSISSDFQKANQASWLGTSYLLATCTFSHLYGRLSNVLGRRGAAQLALSLTALGTLGCGLSPNMNVLIACRFLAGMGGSGLFTVSNIVTSDMYSLRDRSLTQGIASLFLGVGLGGGGPFGGLMADTWGWRSAFLVQLPLYVISFTLITLNLNYVTPGKGRSAKEVLGRIDFGGCFTLFVFVGSLLVFLSLHYNEDYPWGNPLVIASLIVAGTFFLLFLAVEFRLAREPVLAPQLLGQRIPTLVGISNMLVAFSNFSVTYSYPLWFQTVQLSSTATAGLHLLPNSVSMSLGSLFAGWVMHRTGKYRALSVIFGILPTIAALNIGGLREDSSAFAQWFYIIPLGFGNAVVLQTTLIALFASVDQPSVAVATGFGQLFRSVGQLMGVAGSSAIFQTLLGMELRKRIQGVDSEDIIRRIRHSSRLVASLPPDLQRAARDSYGASLKVVFYVAAVTMFTAFLVRLGIPEMSIDREPSQPATPDSSEDPGPIQEITAIPGSPTKSKSKSKKPRRLSTYESDSGFDPEEFEGPRK